MIDPYALVIHTDAGPYQHEFHLGTDLITATQFAEEILAWRKPKIGNQILSVTLKRNGEVDRFFNGPKR